VEIGTSAGRPTSCGYLGRLAYGDAVALQESVRAGLRAGSGREALLLLEHPPVYTLGRNADERDLLVDRRLLAERGIEVHETNRGGKITYHGPGQLVGYPVLDLNPDRRDVRRFIGDLQRVLIDTLAHFEIAARARQQPWTGVWVGDRKIASFGVHLSRWLTMHGFALNVTTDLDQFRGIVPCGLAGVEMTSIELESGRRPALSHVAAVCASRFCEVFDRRMEPLAANFGESLLVSETEGVG
jgi:lipoyl(octanoyl) transferase